MNVSLCLFVCLSLGKCPDMPSFPFEKVRLKFKFLSLLTSPEVVHALVRVKEECGKVSDMSLFHTGSGKPLKLEEFDQAQSQASMQVCTVCTCIVMRVALHLHRRTVRESTKGGLLENICSTLLYDKILLIIIINKIMEGF